MSPRGGIGGGGPLDGGGTAPERVSERIPSEEDIGLTRTRELDTFPELSHESIPRLSVLSFESQEFLPHDSHLESIICCEVKSTI